MLSKIYLSLSFIFCFLSLTVSSQNIHQLVEEENVVQLKVLIREDPGQIRATDQYGRTPLMHAAGAKNLEIMELLLNESADVKLEDNWGNDALNIAASSGFLQGVERLLQSGADINSQNRWDIAPLHYALNSQNIELAKLLLGKGADPNVVGHWGTPLQIAVKKENLEMLPLLFKFGADPDIANSVGNTAVHTAVYANNPGIMKEIIRKGAALDIANALGYLPVHIASVCGYTQMFRILEGQNAELYASNGNGKSVDYFARYYHHPELEKYLEKKDMLQGKDKLEAEKYTLDIKPGYGQAKIFYLGHSGWAVETKSHYLVFDYYPYLEPPAQPSLYNGNINLDELTDKPLMVFGAPRSVRKYNKPMWMKVPYRPICRTGESRCDSNGGNNIAKAHNEQADKLHQLGLVTQLVVVNLPKWLKPVTLLEETAKSTARVTRGKMVLRVSQRLRMNVGYPNAANVQCWRGSRRCP